MRKKDPQKQKHIYRAALEIIKKHGLEGLKMSEVAKEAGLATGTLYIYFKNKESLIENMHEELKERKIAILLKGYQTGMAFEPAFELLWFNYLEYLLSQSSEFHFFKQYHRTREVENKSIDDQDEFIQTFSLILNKGKESGQLKSVPTSLIVAHLIGSIEKVVWHYFGGKVQLDKDAISAAYQMAWKSVIK